MSAAQPAALAPLAMDVVSIQSQVVYGRVGNSVAVPVLQAAGLRVAAVPSVILSNTPHYPSIHGGATPDEWFAGWLDDLDARGATAALRAIQVGFLGRPSQARALAGWIDRQIAAHPQILVQIDPVIGDNDHGVYVDPGLTGAWHELLPRADGLTPNGFELEQLTGTPCRDLDALTVAARTLLRGRTRWVAVTSALPQHWPAGRMLLALVSADGVRMIEHARVAAEPKGTGDLFAAALAARLLAGADLESAATAAARHVVESIELTRSARCAELLIAGLDALRAP